MHDSAVSFIHISPVSAGAAAGAPAEVEAVVVVVVVVVVVAGHPIHPIF